MIQIARILPRSTGRSLLPSSTYFVRTTSTRSSVVPVFNSIRTRTMASSAIPKTQKAILIHETGGPEVLKYADTAVPTISPTQVLVKNSYAGVNFIESYFRKGLYPAKYPLVLGREGAGEVVAVGDKVTNFQVGDRVGYIFTPGTFAEYTAVESTSRVVKLPDDISEKDWAAAAIQLLTAHSLIYESHPLKKGETALINAPVGGVGQYLVPLAKEIGATVIATTSSEEKAHMAKALGADYVINYKTEDIAKRVQEITHGKGVNVSYDSAGASTFQSSMDSLARRGTYVSYGNSSGAVPPISLLKIPQKNIKITRPTLFVFLEEPEEWKLYTDRFFDALRSKSLKINIYKEYPLSEYPEATKELESGKTVGKLLLKI